jgi:signal transduction histidine kinase
MLIERALWIFAVFLSAGLYLFLSILLFPQRKLVNAGAPAWLAAVAACVSLYLAFGIRYYEASQGGDLPYGSLWIGLAVGAGAVALVAFLKLAHLALQRGERTFAISLAIAIAIALFPVSLSMDVSSAGQFSAAPGLCLAWFVARERTLGLTLSRQSIFALAVGVSAAAYLFLVRRISGFLEDNFQAVGALVELLLLFAAGLLWIPIYRAILRFSSRRAQEYADFAKSVVEEAASILDVSRRIQFFCEELKARFGLHRVVLLDTVPGEVSNFDPSRDVLHVGQAAGETAAMMRRYQCNYLFPLRHQERLTGVLMIDTAGLVHLDDREPVIVALAAQISQSVESCRLVEEKIALERELARQENLANLGKAAATLAHEIKNPLSAIKTIAQVMREDQALTAEYDRDLSFLVSEVDRLDRSVRQLLGFAKSSQPLDQQVDATTLLATVSAGIARQAEAMGVRLKAEVEQGLVMEHSNAELVQQIVVNLLLNGLDASPAGTELHLSAVREGAWLRMVIRDQGPGIPPELRKRVFDPFLTTKQKGTGLGLAIVRKNVQMLSGRVHFEFPDSVGTVAVVELPVDRTA